MEWTASRTRIRVPRDGTNSENRRCCFGVVRAATGDSVAQRDYYLALALELLARADGSPILKGALGLRRWQPAIDAWPNRHRTRPVELST